MDMDELRKAIVIIAQRLANISIPCGFIDEIGIPVSESVKSLRRIIVLLNEADDNKEPKEE